MYRGESGPVHESWAKRIQLAAPCLYENDSFCIDYRSTPSWEGHCPTYSCFHAFAAGVPWVPDGEAEPAVGGARPRSSRDAVRAADAQAGGLSRKVSGGRLSKPAVSSRGCFCSWLASGTVVGFCDCAASIGRDGPSSQGTVDAVQGRKGWLKTKKAVLSDEGGTIVSQLFSCLSSGISSTRKGVNNHYGLDYRVLLVTLDVSLLVSSCMYPGSSACG